MAHWEPHLVVCQGCHSYYVEKVSSTIFPWHQFDPPLNYVDLWCPFCGSLCRAWKDEPISNSDWKISNIAFDKENHLVPVGRPRKVI